MRNFVTTITAATVIVLLVLSCVSGSVPSQKSDKPSEEGSPAEERPEWVDTVPRSTEEFSFFVGKGTAEKQSEAREKAIQDAVEEVMSSFGVRPTPRSSKRARTAYRELQSTMIERTSRSVSETWTDQAGEATTVCLLVALDKEALENKGRMIRSVFSKHHEAVTLAEEKADSLYERSMVYHAGNKYLEASIAALHPAVRDGDKHFIRNIENAIQAYRNITLVKANNYLETNINEPFAEPFLLKVYTDLQDGRKNLADVGIEIKYKQMTQDGNFVTTTETASTDQQGELAFYRPAPRFLGKETVAMGLEIGRYEEELKKVPPKFSEYVDLLQETIEKQSVRFVYTSLSQADTIPTGIYIVEVDRAGNPRESNDSASGILESLSGAGFAVEILPLDVPLQEGEEQLLLEIAEEKFGDAVERLIFGVVGISNFSDTNGSFTVEVSGTIKVAELGSRKILYRESDSTRTRGSDIRTAMSAAFKGLGREFGETMAKELP